MKACFDFHVLLICLRPVVIRSSDKIVTVSSVRSHDQLFAIQDLLAIRTQVVGVNLAQPVSMNSAERMVVVLNVAAASLTTS